MLGLFPGSEASLFKTSGFGVGLAKVVKKSLANRAKERQVRLASSPGRVLRIKEFVPITELAKRFASRCHLVAERRSAGAELDALYGGGQV